MQSDDARRGDYASGFGLETATTSDIHGRYKTKVIRSGESRDVVCRFRSLGVLDMDSYLPISMCPGGVMVLEVTWASDQRSCCNTTAGLGHD